MIDESVWREFAAAIDSGDVNEIIGRGRALIRVGCPGLLPKPTPVTVVQKPPRKTEEQFTATRVAVLSGYTGASCSRCHGMRVRRTGKCPVCEECGHQEGCS